MFDVIAHRGGRVNPNTMSAFKSSAEMGVDFIECDVCLTKDGQPIIYHPRTLIPDAAEETWENLRGRNIDHAGRLIELLSIYPKLKCLLDLKQDSKKLVEIMVKMIKVSDMFKRVYFTAPYYKIPLFELYADKNTLLYARSLDERVKIHVIDIFPINMSKTIRTISANMISFGWFNEYISSRFLFKAIFDSGFRTISKEILKVYKEEAYVLGGIANTEKDIKRLVLPGGYRSGINGIITDEPELALKIRDKLAQK